MLNPSMDLYVPVDAVIKYQVEQIRNTRIEGFFTIGLQLAQAFIISVVQMPSIQYYLELSKSDICNLNTMTSEVTAAQLGATDIILKDRSKERFIDHTWARSGSRACHN